MNDKRQKNQSESFAAKCETESPAAEEQLIARATADCRS
jgi:hypothetical protein